MFEATMIGEIQYGEKGQIYFLLVCKSIGKSVIN